MVYSFAKWLSSVVQQFIPNRVWKNSFIYRCQQVILPNIDNLIEWEMVYCCFIIHSPDAWMFRGGGFYVTLAQILKEADIKATLRYQGSSLGETGKGAEGCCGNNQTGSKNLSPVLPGAWSRIPWQGTSVSSRNGPTLVALPCFVSSLQQPLRSMATVSPAADVILAGRAPARKIWLAHCWGLPCLI